MNEELKSINMNNPNERALLALTTKNFKTLNWLAPDIELQVKLNIIKNPLFNRDLFERINYDELEIKEGYIYINNKISMMQKKI